jgi:hypothetical protein
MRQRMRFEDIIISNNVRLIPVGKGKATLQITAIGVTDAKFFEVGRRNDGSNKIFVRPMYVEHVDDLLIALVLIQRHEAEIDKKLIEVGRGS